MKIYHKILILGALLCITVITAQDKPCSFEEDMESYYKKNPEERKRAEVFEKKIQENILLKKSTHSKKAGPYIIPVVFHIYDAKYPDNPETGEVRNVTDERVKQALKDINEDFKGFNDAVDASFANIEGGMDIEFRLAQVDPRGNTTTGIIYHERKEGFGLSSNDAEIAKYAWDNFKYMNVHVQEIIKSGSKNQSGIAWFPAVNMSEEGTARVVYNGKYMIYSPPASSLTHEFGHFLNLHHTFNGGCVSGDDNGDKVADTPPCTSGQASEAGNTCKTGVLNCFNQLINHQNHMDYNPCESMFTKGQVARMEESMNHDARKTLWTDANLTATGTNQADLGARVIFTYQKSDDSAVDQALAFIEGFTNNNGDILNKKRIKAAGGAKFAITGQMQEGVHFSTTGVPNGLTTSITVEDDENAYITFTGNATNHSEADSKEVKITLLNAAIVGGVGSLYSDTGVYDINFIDPYKPYYEMYSPAIVTGRSVQNYADAVASEFNSLVIGGRFRTRLRSYDGNTVTIDNNAMEFDVLCNTGTKNVTNLSEGTTISANSSGTWVGRQDIGTSPPKVGGAGGYTAWHGRTGYAAIRVPTITGDYVYGWLRIKMRSNGEYAELITFALNPDPGKSIQAKVAVPNLLYSSDRFLESVKNDGTIENEITVDVKDATLSVSGTLSSGTHYSVRNVPQGLTLQVRVVNSTQLRLTMSGIAQEADWAAYNGFVKDIRLKFKSSIFANGVGDQVEFKAFPLNVEYIGSAYTKEPSPIKRFVVGNTSENGGVTIMPGTYNLDAVANVSYQFQDYTSDVNEFPGVKFVSWRKDAVANDNYELTPLAEGTSIGPNLSWKNGREYNEGRGQHMIDSDTYRSWRGRTDYVGIRIQRSGRFHYGWIKLRVGTSGTTCEILEYGLQGIPEASIIAGSKDSNDVQTYCDAHGTHGDEGITDVEFAGIDNSSNRDASGYEDNTGYTAFVARGKSYPLKVNVVGWNGGSAAKIHAWFDWNQDYDFSDSGEAVVVTKTSDGVGEVSINVPTNALLGVTRMRLRVDDNNSNFSCGTANTRGEVEDYHVNVGIANASCTDGEQNGDETGIDCGGSSCNDCIPEPTCTDGIRNGGETEVDCGGEFCEPCEIFTEHCDATTDGHATLRITNVTFGTINNSSEGATYTDYSSITTNLEANQQSTLTVTLNGSWEPNVLAVWIDWNNDNDFRDDGEQVLSQKGEGPYTSVVTPPSSSVSGVSLRMRVRVGYSGKTLTPCGNDTGFGEVEDYRVTVSGGTEPTCTDGIQNGDETGVDCGGSCDPCTVDPTCTDGIQNGDETGVDCGGSCSPCQTDITYCDMSGNNSGDDSISNVTFAGINNSSTSTTVGYENFTTVTGNVTKGSSENLIVTIIGYQGGANNEVYAWFDWNQNGVFTDAGEKFSITTAPNDTTRELSIDVPSSATTGTTRMRIVVGYNASDGDSSCGTISYGQVEDYSINVTGGSDSTCTDGIQNGDETGVDCGGSCSACQVDPTCTDGIQNGDETGVDCGGSCDPCTVDSTCTDGIQNGDETGVDCGGSCDPCTVDPTCTDGIQNGDETGVDCGGSCSPCQTDVTYCSATGNAGPEGITNVTFAGIDNSSVRNATGYDDFTSVSGSVNAGTSYNLRVNIEGYSGGASDEIYAFFDWNLDGDFADAGESFTLTKTTDLIGDVSVAVPATAINGTTRMRLLVSYYDTENNPCDTGTNDVRYGEYEDYSVVISGGSSKSVETDVTIKAYPNPFTNMLTIDVSQLSSGNVGVRIYDIAGKQVIHKDYAKNPGKINLNEVSDLKPGSYFVKIQTVNKTEILRIVGGSN